MTTQTLEESSPSAIPFVFKRNAFEKNMSICFAEEKRYDENLKELIEAFEVLDHQVCCIQQTI